MRLWSSSVTSERPPLTATADLEAEITDVFLAAFASRAVAIAKA
jgi:hypothetical protein